MKLTKEQRKAIFEIREYRVHIVLATQRTITCTNDIDDIRQQYQQQSQMDGSGFICVSVNGEPRDVNVAHIVYFRYEDITKTIGDGH